MQKATAYIKGRHPLLGRPFLILVFLGLTLLLRGTGIAGSDHQKMIHEMGHNVMPFDISKTTHIFEMTETGGIQQVIAKDPIDTEQIRLIREHLRHEAVRFRNGDFSDPASLWRIYAGTKGTCGRLIKNRHRIFPNTRWWPDYFYDARYTPPDGSAQVVRGTIIGTWSGCDVSMT